MTIVIIDKYPILRWGIITLIREHFPLMSVIELDSYHALDLSAASQEVDLIILVGTGQVPCIDYFSMIKSIKKDYPLAKLIAYDEKPEPALVAHYFQAGMQAYISKQAEQKELIDCIGHVINHQRYISREIMDLIMNPNTSGTGLTGRPLSAREIQVASFLCNGMSTSAIAKTLNRKVSTISTIKLNIFQKMRVSNIIQLSEQFALAKSR